MEKIYTNIDQLIGNTPLVELKVIEEELSLKASVIAKLEYFNPAGSVKDRAALFMINEAEKDGRLKKGGVIIEPTSGNTGIGLACVAASRGYKVIIVMPDSMSEERKKLMTAYGAELILTDGKLGMKGAIEKAYEIEKEIPGSFVAGQFSNSANALAHYKTTGPEIYNDCGGNVDIFVAGVGTGGTITGTGKYLKEHIEGIKIYAVEPSDSPVLSEEKSGAHKLQGIGAGFIPEVLDTGIYDEVVTVSTDEAYKAARLLGTKEGILVGISSGAALHTAFELAKKEENKGKRIVVLLPDTGDRYLSTDLF
ncbi:MAG: cysteine synthase A [Ruminococcaceae bacterium]|nr:cysteine synthase A [Oscillospiraceae bacterium]